MIVFNGYQLLAVLNQWWKVLVQYYQLLFYFVGHEEVLQDPSFMDAGDATLRFQ